VTEPVKKQGLLEEMFDGETVERLREKQETNTFPRVDENLDTQYRCPCCSYEWSGNPKPPIGTDIEAEEDDEAKPKG